MEPWLIDLLAMLNGELTSQGLDPAEVSYATKRRMAINRRWTSSAVRAAEQDARLGNPAALNRYDQEVAAIKAAIPKPAA
ncbi:MAG: hypothetical protein HQL42_13015 [Alphaproteobacteria bacterium]|nr:hypothetical protein [Alphaproteobacteria bacterium]